MGGPSQHRERLRARSAYLAAVDRLRTAQAHVRAAGVVLDPPGLASRPPVCWTAAQYAAMRECAVAWYEVCLRREEYEGTWGAVPPHE